MMNKIRTMKILRRVFAAAALLVLCAFFARTVPARETGAASGKNSPVTESASVVRDNFRAKAEAAAAGSIVSAGEEPATADGGTVAADGNVSTGAEAAAADGKIFAGAEAAAADSIVSAGEEPAAAEGGTAVVKEPDVVEGRIFIEDICVSGLTLEEVQDVIDAKMNEFLSGEITIYVRDNPVIVPASSLGLYYENTGLAESILRLQKHGNIWRRFQMDRYLNDSGGIVFALDLRADEAAVRSVVETQCAAYDIPRQDLVIHRAEDGSFYADEKVDGNYVDVETAAANLCAYINEQWHGGAGRISVPTVTDSAKGNPEDVRLMTDVLGSGVTTFDNNVENQGRNQNIVLATQKLNGLVVFPGEEFSTITPMEPFTEEYGWQRAPAYEQGQVIEDLGGGICQVSSTLYRAVLEAELQVVERNQHSMTVRYVEPSMDATISEGVKDLRFVNNTDAPIYIEGSVSDNQVVFHIYGHETRPANRTLDFESEVLSTTPFAIDYSLDSQLEFGALRYEGGHEGMTACAYKLVYVDGILESREKISTSEYAMSNATCSIGTAGAPEGAIPSLQAAADSRNQDAVNQVITANGGVPHSVS